MNMEKLLTKKMPKFAFNHKKEGSTDTNLEPSWRHVLAKDEPNTTPAY